MVTINSISVDHTNKKTIEKIADLVNDRNECYTRLNCVTRLSIPDVPQNTLPYIEIKKNNFDYSVDEPPIFYFQLLAAAMAEIDGSTWDIINELSNFHYTAVTVRLGFAKACGLACPHYLQSYYFISNKI